MFSAAYTNPLMDVICCYWYFVAVTLKTVKIARVLEKKRLWLVQPC